MDPNATEPPHPFTASPLLAYPWGLVGKSLFLARASTPVYLRGVDYRLDGHVLNLQDVGDQIQVDIKGKNGQTYFVTLGWPDQTDPKTLLATDLETSCTCPHAAQGHCCKHVVSAGLTLPLWWKQFQEKQQLLRVCSETLPPEKPNPPSRRRI